MRFSTDVLFCKLQLFRSTQTKESERDNTGNIIVVNFFQNRTVCGQRKIMYDISLLHLSNIYFIDKFHHIVFWIVSLIDHQNQVELDVFRTIYNFKQNECSTAAKPKYTFAFPPWPSQNGEEDFRCQQSVQIYLLRITTDMLFSTNIGSSCHWMSRCCLTTSDEFLL